MEAVMEEIELTVEQEEEVRRIEDIVVAAARVEARKMARLLVSKQNSELLGETEFRIRDMVRNIGARGIDAALAERKKRGTRGPA
jgi:hypothetical protein